MIYARTRTLISKYKIMMMNKKTVCDFSQTVFFIDQINEAIIPATGPITIKAISTMHKAVISFFFVSLFISNTPFLIVVYYISSIDNCCSLASLPVSATGVAGSFSFRYPFVFSNIDSKSASARVILCPPFRVISCAPIEVLVLF